MVSIRGYTVPAFREYLQGYRDRGAVLRCTFLHHTYSPTPANWNGLKTMQGIRTAHRRRGFSDIACHAYSGPDGLVYNGRAPNVSNCACQYPDEGSSTWPAELRKLSNGSKRWMNAYGFGLETVGNFDEEDPAQSAAMSLSLDVLAQVHDIWGIPVAHSFFHRDVSSKTCPGKRVTKTWVRAELTKRMNAEPAPKLRVILYPKTEEFPYGQVVDCHPENPDGTTRGDVTPLAGAMGYRTHYDPANRKVYLIPKED